MIVLVVPHRNCRRSAAIYRHANDVQIGRYVQCNLNLKGSDCNQALPAHFGSEGDLLLRGRPGFAAGLRSSA